MVTIQDLTRLKERVERAKQDAARASGALEQAFSRLKEQYGCKTLEEAEAKLKELRGLETKAEEKFTSALDKFRKEYSEKERS